MIYKLEFRDQKILKKIAEPIPFRHIIMAKAHKPIERVSLTKQEGQVTS
jgi:hypothetical protein